MVAAQRVLPTRRGAFARGRRRRRVAGGDGRRGRGAFELAISGTVPLGTVLPAMLGVHALIGVGEAVDHRRRGQRRAGHPPRPRAAPSPLARSADEDAPLHDPRARPGRSASAPRLAVRLVVARRARARRRPTRRSSTRAASRRCRSALRCRTTRSRASRTRGWPPASPGSPARSVVFAARLRRRAVVARPMSAHALNATGIAGDPASPSTAWTRGRSSSGFAGVTLVAVSTPLRAVAGARRLRARARGGRGRRARRAGVLWSRARVVLPLVLFVAVFVPFVRGGAQSRSGRSRCREAGLPTFATVAAKATIGTSARCCSARRRASPTSCTGSSGCARRACCADRGLHVPLPVRDRRRDAAHAHRARRARLPAAARAPGGGDRARRDRDVPAHLRPRRARLRGDARARLRRDDAAAGRACVPARGRRCSWPRSPPRCVPCGSSRRWRHELRDRGARPALPLPERRRRARRRRPVASATASASPCSARTAPARRR